MAKLALLIGVSEYDGFNPLPSALKDVEAMGRILQHPDIGGFTETDVKVLKNPHRQEMESAIEKLFSNRQKDDLVLLYFSGHGIKDDSGRLFLTNHLTRKNDKGELIKTSAVAASMVHDVMENSRSRRQVIVLDCCFSGAFVEGMRAKDDDGLDINNQLGGEGRAVLTSSTATQYSFEQKGSDLSIYTHFIVEGIEKGTADIDKDGVITVDELHEYARNKVQEIAPTMKPGIYAVREGYKIQLAKAQTMTQQQKPKSIIHKINLGKLNLATVQHEENGDDIQPQAAYLHNFLEPYESFISQLINRLQDEKYINNNSEIESRILEIIRQASVADFVFILRNDSQENCLVKSQSDLAAEVDRDAYIGTLKSIIIPSFSQKSVFNPYHHGIYKTHEYRKGSFNAFVVIPLKSAPEAEVMVICGLQQDSYLLEDAYGRILSSFYQAWQKLSLQPALIEAAILDDLKRDFSFVSASLYDRRFKLFCERLQRMVVYFEPVLHLDPQELFISGWEALARNPDSLTAPSDLFAAAELWGPRFTIELDQYFLTTATESYRQARQKIKQNRPHEIVPLSVNVYPESLMRRAYFETVHQILKDKVISPRNLILEISEKAELPKFEDGNPLESPLTAFKARLLEYVRKFKIRFAIDDFGVGYASVSRLAGLNPSHVKIDREILHHQPSEIIIRFVHELVGANNLNPSSVIVEGVDETTPISLQRLKEIGVSYIQGHIVGKPEPEIYRLSLEKTEFLRKLL